MCGWLCALSRPQCFAGHAAAATTAAHLHNGVQARSMSGHECSPGMVLRASSCKTSLLGQAFWRGSAWAISRAMAGRCRAPSWRRKQVSAWVSERHVGVLGKRGEGHAGAMRGACSRGAAAVRHDLVKKWAHGQLGEVGRAGHHSATTTLCQRWRCRLCRRPGWHAARLIASGSLGRGAECTMIVQHHATGPAPSHLQRCSGGLWLACAPSA